jgi:stress-induced-phosphoprotein 1
LLAKALGRIGNAYTKKGDLDNAVKYYRKSLAEHRAPDILQKLNEVRLFFHNRWNVVDLEVGDW